MEMPAVFAAPSEAQTGEITYKSRMRKRSLSQSSVVLQTEKRQLMDAEGTLLQREKSLNVNTLIRLQIARRLEGDCSTLVLLQSCLTVTIFRHHISLKLVE